MRHRDPPATMAEDRSNLLEKSGKAPPIGASSLRSGAAPPAGASDSPPQRADLSPAALERGPTLVFDGVCNLCNGAMHWYFHRLDPSHVDYRSVTFLWLQHPKTQALLEKNNVTDISESWALFEQQQIHRGSTAWLRAML